ncbi:ROK family protein [Priestia endophytica]|jgi:beta-glucoside kinase|uniref:Beta-glucoside kinase n=1 Tax=Priestia endophytica DSM 13796 TaxID=1121089 RepID=A0A1I6BZE0_9BACI|nr:ROK family protein [Priestia endophytica]KYG27770.1 hypothetical protein AZF06_12220 [Priestia endophytica]MBG9813204.1 hypothetical protein [Priestia endophytica]SFQ86302.1 beta-glucoside kinase [Priestia endophytica DSM 13796]
MAQYVVIDIGGTTIKHAVMNHEAECLKSGSITTPKQGEKQIFNSLLDIINSYQKSFMIRGVALSVPGAVNPENGYVYFAGAVTDLTGRYLKKELSTLHLPIELENDANCATLAEKWRGNATECESFICITAGTGIGGGIFINGDLYRGRKGMAGEFGLMSLLFDEQLETALDRFSFSNMGSTRALVEDVSNGLDQKVSGEEIFLLQDNITVNASLNKFYNAFTSGCTNIIHALAPEKLLIGGGISSQPEFINEIKKRMEKIRKETLDITEVSSCYFKNDAGKVGALYHFLKRQKII